MLDDMFDWLRRVIEDILDWLYSVLPYGEGWEWNPRRHRWEYAPSRGNAKPYVCTESVIARIRSVPPVYESGDATDTPEFLDELAELGWEQREGGCHCGCGDGQCKDCVVVYLDPGGDVAHAAIFDHVRCDWGSKLGSGLPVARFRRPEDYYADRRVPEGERMVFFCPGAGGTHPAAGQQVRDEGQHAAAHKGP